MVKRVQVDAANGDSRRIDGKQFAPKFFFRRVQTDDNNRMRFHLRGSLFLDYRISRYQARSTLASCADSELNASVAQDVMGLEKCITIRTKPARTAMNADHPS